MRKSIVASATALAVVATGLAVVGVVGTARPSSAAVGDVPADCSNWTTAYRSDGQRLAYVRRDNKTSTEALPGDNLGWVPTAAVGGIDSGGADSWEGTSLVTHPTDGYLYHLKRVGERIDGVWRVTRHTATRLAPGFAGTRILAGGRHPYYYRVAGNSLYRFKLIYSAGQPPTISVPEKMPGSGWDSVKTLQKARTGGTAAAPVHVLLGTRTNGELKQWRITEATPATISSKVLQSTGWGSFTSLTIGDCRPSLPNGRSLMGITAAGRAAVYFDANEKDGVGTDIKGGWLGLLGWTEKAY